MWWRILLSTAVAFLVLCPLQLAESQRKIYGDIREQKISQVRLKFKIIRILYLASCTGKLVFYDCSCCCFAAAAAIVVFAVFAMLQQQQLLSLCCCRCRSFLCQVTTKCLFKLHIRGPKISLTEHFMY